MERFYTIISIWYVYISVVSSSLLCILEMLENKKLNYHTTVLNLGH